MSNETGLNLEALQDLDSHPGWSQVRAHLEGKISDALTKMQGAKSPDELLKHTYTYLALRETLGIPDLLQNMLKVRLHNSKK